MKTRRAVFVLMLLSLSTVTIGCSTSMTHATGAHTLDQGEVRGGVTTQVDANTNIVSTTLSNARNLEDRIQDSNNTDPLTEEEFRDVLDAAVAFALFRPGYTPEANLRVGIIDTLDLGVRYNGVTLKGDLKYEIAEWDDERQAVSVDVGVGRQFSPAPSIVEIVALTEWSRTDLDVIALYGFEFEPYGRFWIGPRFMQSWIDVQPKLDDELRERIPQEYEDLDPGQFFQDENITYYGGTTGIMAGYKHVYAMVELTVMYSRFTPTIIDEQRNLSGVTFAPNFGVVFEFGGDDPAQL
ncbi:MAG: hypothetical protein ACQEVA_17695 [Myxococcota bacterium]